MIKSISDKVPSEVSSIHNLTLKKSISVSSLMLIVLVVTDYINKSLWKKNVIYTSINSLKACFNVV